jgi:hypothetical protein
MFDAPYPEPREPLKAFAPKLVGEPAGATLELTTAFVAGLEPKIFESGEAVGVVLAAPPKMLARDIIF